MYVICSYFVALAWQNIPFFGSKWKRKIWNMNLSNVSILFQPNYEFRGRRARPLFEMGLVFWKFRWLLASVCCFYTPFPSHWDILDDLSAPSWNTFPPVRDSAQCFGLISALTRSIPVRLRQRTSKGPSFSPQQRHSSIPHTAAWAFVLSQSDCAGHKRFLSEKHGQSGVGTCAG